MIPELVFIALDFYREPRRYPYLLDAQQPLPEGMTALLAAPTTLFSAAQIDDSATELNASVVECREVVPFFIKQVLIDTPGDYYRMLGLTRKADSQQIKQHYHYIIRLFHPDRDGGEENWDDIYAPRINEAYNELRNASRRLAYDQGQISEQDDLEAIRVTTSPAAYQTPVHRSRHVRSSRKAPMSPRLKKLALGLIVLIVAGFSLLIFNQSDQPALRIELNDEASLQADESESIAIEPDEKIQAERVSSAVLVDEPFSGTGDQSGPQAKLSVEEMVRQRVAEATAAVSGASLKADKLPPEVVVPVAVGSETLVTVAVRKQVQNKPPARPETKPMWASTEAPKKAPVKAPVKVAKNTPAVKIVAPASKADPALKASKNSAQIRPKKEIVETLAPVEVVSIAIIAPKAPPKVEPISEPVQSRKPVTSEPLSSKKTAPVAANAIPASAISSGYAATREKKANNTYTSLKRDRDTQQQASSLISTQQTMMLLAAMMSSYEKGNLERFVSLFTNDARTGESIGKPQIYAHYKAQFTRPERRKIAISKLRWENRGPRERIASGEFTLLVTPYDESAPVSRSTSPITLGVKLTPAGLKIKSLVYEGFRE